jgi:hypothetical protein
MYHWLLSLAQHPTQLAATQSLWFHVVLLLLAIAGVLALSLLFASGDRSAREADDDR